MRSKAKLLFGAELCLIIISLAVCSELLAGRAETATAVPQQKGAAAPARPTEGTAAAPQSSAAPSDRARYDTVNAVQLVSGKAGWALTRTRLLWTANSGRQWRDITPALTGGRVLGAFFLDASNGWSVLAAPDERTGRNALTLASTSNGGDTWSYAGLLSPNDYSQGEPGDEVSIHFVDPGHGRVLVKLASGSNFSRGLLLESADGGASWGRLPDPPSAGSVRFATEKDGWLAGGPEARDLYVTRDGGHTWAAVSIDALGGGPQTSVAHFDLPRFRNQDEGTLPVTLAGAGGVAVRFYETSDRGKTWRLKQTVPVSDGPPRSNKVASAVVAPDLFVVASPGGPRVTVVEKGKTSKRDVAAKESDAVISEIDFKSRAAGWVLTRAGRCEGFKTRCSQETRLLATEDGGETLTDITPQAPADLPPGDGDSFDTIPGPGAVFTSRNRKGFDKCAADTVSNMLTWWNNSPYYDANIYIGGVNRGCSQSNLTSSWVSQVFAQGWGLIPTWVGPQATCTTCTTCSVMSADPATAASQGVSEANSASNAAAALGLTNTIIYYDMERYNPTTSCQNSVRAFLNAFVQQTHARGNLAGVYGSPQNAQEDWAVIANAPDAVWIAKWDGRESVFGLTPLSDSLWVSDQRIHQYQGGHNETYGGVTFNIDNDYDDAPVAGPSSSQSLPNLTPYQPSGWSDRLVVSNVTGTSTDAGALKTTDTIYVDWAVLNNGSAATAATFYTRLYVDGVERTSWFTNPPLNVSGYAYVQDYSIGTLSAGTHTIKITTDATGAVSESSESDNEYTKTITVVSPGQPNLTPYQPPGWSDKVVVSNVPGTGSDSSPLRTTDTLYVDWAVINNGAAATGATFYTRLLVDGVERASWYTDPPLNVNNYVYVQDYSIGSLSAGTHTVKIVTDSTGAVSESGESDNEYTKTITVTAPGQPNLTPYQPSGWSDEIVVSNATGTSADSASLKTTDTLYVDWAVANNGAAATGATFYTRLLVDGVERASWYTDPPLNVNNYIYIQDYSIGSLSAGTHTIKVVADSTGAVAESNESDNEYTKTITVASGSPVIRIEPTTLNFNQTAAPAFESGEVPASAPAQGGGGRQNLVGQMLDEAGVGRVQGRRESAVAASVVNFAELARADALKPAVPQERRFVPEPEEEEEARDRPLPPGAKVIRQPAGADEAVEPLGPSPSASASFQAVQATGWVPPDTQGAAGPNHLVAAVNGGVLVQSKTGSNVGLVRSLSTFFSAVMNGSTDVFDPRVQYDSIGGRWILIATADRSSAASAIVVGVSQTSDPTGNWNLSRIDVDSANQSWADYPMLGFNKDWIVVSTNMFPNPGSGAQFYARFFVLNKANFYSGGTPTYTQITAPNSVSGGIMPACTYDASLSALYLLQEWNGNSGGSGYLRLYSITGAVGSEVLNGVSSSVFVSTPNPWGDSGGNIAPQQGTSTKIQVNDASIQNLVYRNGSLWAVQSVFLPAASPTRSSVQWWQIAPATASVQQRGRIDDASGNLFYGFPSIAVNSNNDMLIGYSRFSSAQYAGAGYAFRGASDPANTTRDDTPLKAGAGTYSSLDDIGRNRWGDYSGTVVDPSDDRAFWTIQEYAASTNVWGTWWGRVTPTDTGTPGSFTIYNDGTSTLTVTGISKQNGSSWLSYSTPSSVPFDIAPGGSAQVNVSVAAAGLAAGSYSDRLLVSSNDGARSPYPNAVNINLSVTTQAPQAPTAGAATNVTGTGFTANWGGSSGATGYRLDVSTGSSFGSFVSGYQDLDVGNALSRAVSGLSGGTTYYYRVRAYNAGGTSGNSGTVSLTTTATALRIDNVTPKAGRASGGQTVTLTGAFAGLSSVSIGGTLVPWSYTSGTGAVSFTTPAHAAGAVDIVLTPTAGSNVSRSRAFAYLSTVFTDNTLTAGVTTAKAQHVTELRQSIDALRAVAGLSPAPWTELTLFNFVTQIKVGHIREMRTYLEEAAASLGYPATTYTDAELGAGSVIRRVHIEELRQRVRLIAG